MRKHKGLFYRSKEPQVRRKMKPMELLDVLDEKGNETGKVEDKDIIHEKGLWHKEVDAWIVNEKGEILIQKRAATKST